MVADFGQSQENLASMIENISHGGNSHRNEATTRLQLIDELLFNCLAWEKADCVAEESYQGTYTDYSLGKPQANLIIEAKKEDIHFDVPAGLSAVTYRIGYFKETAPDVYSAIEQAMRYCQSRGVPFGAVCNGHQFVAFLASRTDGIPPMDGKALVLNSLQHIADNFLIFWNSLSGSGVASRGLAVLLQELDQRPPPDKLSIRIPNYPRYQVRNSLQTDLQVFGDLIIEDVGKLPENEAEFLRQCYADSGALSQYALVSRSVLRSRYSKEFEESIAGPSLVDATKKGGEPTITSEMLAQSATKRPVLLIGDVGVGKTMFVRHFIAVEAADLLQDAIIIYLDLGIKPTLESDLDAFLNQEITRQLLEEYGIDIAERGFVHAVYNGPLEGFEKGIYGGLRSSDPNEYRKKTIEFLEAKIADTHQHLRQCLEHINKGRNKQIVIFLDNVDQRPDSFQQRAFLIGQSMAELWPALVFVSLRPETYHRSRMDGTLSAYHVKAFTISPPRVDRVIHKRLQYAIKLLESGTIGTSMEGVGIHVDLQDLLDYLKILDHSFEQNVELIEFVDNVCGGNIRLALDFIRTFVGSGHANTAKMLEIYRGSGRYDLALHEFLRAVTFGDYRDYDPGYSEIVNLFDIGGIDGREHFLSPIVLSYLEHDSRGSEQSGYVATEDVYKYAQNSGFQPMQITTALGKLLKGKLIETDTKRSFLARSESQEHYYRITTIGSYYYQKLIGKFTYLDAMIVDTPVVDRAVRERIRDETSIKGRLERAQIFRNYLDSQWQYLESSSDVFDWRPLSSQLYYEIDHIKSLVSTRDY